MEVGNLDKKRERDNKISKLMGEYLLKGYKMLGSTCNACGVSMRWIFILTTIPPKIFGCSQVPTIFVIIFNIESSFTDEYNCLAFQ